MQNIRDGDVATNRAESKKRSTGGTIQCVWKCGLCHFCETSGASLLPPKRGHAVGESMINVKDMEIHIVHYHAELVAPRIRRAIREKCKAADCSVT